MFPVEDGVGFNPQASGKLPLEKAKLKPPLLDMVAKRFGVLGEF